MRFYDEGLRPWRTIPTNDATPFVHRFQTPGQKYVYDVNTRRILRVSSLAWDIIEDYGHLDTEQLLLKYSPPHTASDIAAAIAHIESTRQQGLLLSVRPSEILPPSREYLQRKLGDEREQLILNVTEDCNLRCSYCVFGSSYQQFRQHSRKTMSWDVARAAIDDFLMHSGQYESRVISFYGGEPLLSLPLIRQSVAYAKEKTADLPVRFSLTTNGMLLKGQAARFLADERFAILVSLDGPAAIHDLNRRTASNSPSWARVTSNLRRFLEDFPEYQTNGMLRFSSVATPAMDLREIRDFWNSCGLFTDAMGLEISGQRPTEAESRPLPPESPLAMTVPLLHEDFISALKQGSWAGEYHDKQRWVEASVFQRPFLLFHKRDYLTPHLPEKMVLQSTCTPGARRVFVNTEGDYFACERVVPCEAQKIGDVRQGVQLDKVMALLGNWTKSSPEQCRFCWCVSHCHVGCLATVGQDGQVSREAKTRACAMCRRQLHGILCQYAAILEENPHAFDYSENVEFS